MGLFSSKKKTYVSSATINAGGDKHPRKYFGVEAVTNSILAHSDSLADDLMTTILNGAGVKMRSYYRYGRDHYSEGLPTGSITHADMDTSFLEQFIKTEIAPPDTEVLIIDTNAGLPNYAFWVLPYMTEHYGYDPETDLLVTYPPGVPGGWDFDYVTRLNNQGVIDVWLIFTNPIFLDDDYEEDIDENNPNHVIKIKAPIDLSDVITSETYVSVIFRYLEGTTVTEPIYTVGIAGADDKPLPYRTTTRRIIDTDTGVMTVKRVGTQREIKTVNSTLPGSDDIFSPDDYPEGSLAYVEGYEPKNGDVVYISMYEDTVGTLSAAQYFNYQIGLGTYPDLDVQYTPTGKPASDYLPIVFFRENKWDMFQPAQKQTEKYKTSKRLLKKIGMDALKLREELNKNSDINDVNDAYFICGIDMNTVEPVGIEYLLEHFSYWGKLLPLDKADSLANPGKEQFIWIQSGNFDCRVGMKYIQETVKVGVIGTVGTLTKTRGNIEDEYEVIPPVYDQNGTLINGGTTIKRTNSVIFLRKQINRVQYREIEISGLNYFNRIYGDRGDWREAWYSLEEKHEGFVVPSLYSVLQKFPIAKLTQLAKDNYHFVFNTWVVKKIKWYQSWFGSSAFKIVLVVIAVVATIYGMYGLYEGISAVAAAATAAGGSVAMAVSAYLAEVLITGFAISYGAKAATKLLGSDIAILAVIAMTVYGSMGKFNGQLPMASEIANAVPAVIRGSQAAQAEKLAKLQNEIAAFSKMADAKNKEIEEALEKLNASKMELDISRISASAWAEFESPLMFFTRTQMSDPNTPVIESLSGFTERMLTLPQLIY